MVNDGSMANQGLMMVNHMVNDGSSYGYRMDQQRLIVNPW